MQEQTHLKSRVIQKQSEINWTLLKKIYLQGAQKISPPEPDFERNGGNHEFNEIQSSKWSKVEQNFKNVLTEVYRKNEQFLDSLQNKFTKLNMDLRQRISKLESQINLLKRGKQIFISKHQIQFQKADQQIDQYQPEINPQASFIHIEQKQQESLLQGIQQNLQSTKSKKKKQSEHQSSQQQTIKKEIINKIYFGKQSPKKMFSQDQEQKDMKYFPSPKTNQYHKNQPLFFDKNYKNIQEEINNLRSFIGEDQHVQIPSSFHQQHSKLPQQKPQSNSKKMIYEIKNAQQHLRNQNLQLRLVMNKYKSQLIKTQYELAEIKILLQNNLNDEFEFIEIQ